ncbi:MAG: hypothetical protein NTZ09_21325 [Candidatus Hydrogenedentes bacterium]|nr:hypothetical protein [Candidatus Hydrogenedentota bacterium]
MSVSGGQKDLVVLVADGTMKNALMGILNRPESIAIRNITFQIYPHHRHDPGCLLESHDFLRRFAGQFYHALVVFDKEGCGREHCSKDELEAEVKSRLSASGWGERASVKPQRPKEAMKEVLRLVKKPFSSAIHQELAETVSFERCQDLAFLRLKSILRQWFPPLPSD